jgi:hypothetical protein
LECCGACGDESSARVQSAKLIRDVGSQVKRFDKGRTDTVHYEKLEVKCSYTEAVPEWQNPQNKNNS